jgi:hypothetical protein
MREVPEEETEEVVGSDLSRDNMAGMINSLGKSVQVL